MIGFRIVLAGALCLSLGIHVAAVALTLTSKPELEIAGGGDVQAVLLGSSPFSTITAGAEPQVDVAVPVEPVVTPEPEHPLSSVVQPVQAPSTESQQVAAEVAAIEPVQAEIASDSVPVTQDNGTLSDATNVKALPEVSRQTTPELSERPQEPTPAKAVQPPETETKPDPGAVPPVAAGLTPPVEEAAPTARRKPVDLEQAKPQHQAQTEARKTNKKREEKTAEASRASKAGAGGQSAATTQKGGSQRKGNSSTAGNSDVTNYPAKVHRKVLRAVRAPRGTGHLKADAHVRFTVSARGQVSGVRLVQSSGNKPFDDAAIQSVQRAAPFPAIPAAAGRASWTFTIPIGAR